MFLLKEFLLCTGVVKAADQWGKKIYMKNSETIKHVFWEM